MVLAKNTKSRVWDHYDTALKLHGNSVMGVFLQGSQNYGLEYEGSDVDTKAIVLPTFKSIILNGKPNSYTHVMENNEHLDIKDIRLMIDCFKKQNINFVEILFTELWVPNGLWVDELIELRKYRDEIANYNNYITINCIAGMSMEKYKALEHPYPTLVDKIKKFGYDCYTDDTEFLTHNGWKRYYEISDDEKIGTYNKDTSSIEYQNFTSRVCKEHNGSIFEVDTYNSNFRVTPNHNLYVSKININKDGHKYNEVNANWRLESATNVINNKTESKHAHLASIENINSELKHYDGINIDDELLRIIGAFISDGTVAFKNGVPKAIRITQSVANKGHNLEFINMMDSIINYNLGRYSYKNSNEIAWTLSSRKMSEKILNWCNHGSKNKKLPDFYNKLSKRQCIVLLNALLLGDGSSYRSRYVYYTTSSKLADDVQMLAELAGFNSVKMGGETGYKNKCRFRGVDFYTYHVSIKTKEKEPNWCYFKVGKNVKEYDYHGNVVCFEVPNSILITRRCGKIAVQGNCKQLHHIIRLNEFIKRWTSGVPYAECLISEQRDYLIDVKRGYHTLDEAREIATSLNNETYSIKTEYMKNNELVINHDVDEILNEFMCRAIKKWFRLSEGV